MVDAPSKKTESNVAQDWTMAAQALEKVAKPAMDLLTWLLPIVITQTRFLYQQYQKLPQNALHFSYGFVFCFFGGTFPTLFAALQAAEYGGRVAVGKALSDLADEAIVIMEASKKDDEVDANKDGKSDTAQLSRQEYLTRKTKLVLQKMNPQKVDAALASIYRVWLAVVAVLKIEFARTISMALAIADFLNKPVNRFITPTVEMIMPNEYDKWVPVIMSWITKSIAMSLAFYVQSVISATASSLKGGLMMASATFHFFLHRGITLGGIVPSSPDQTYLDEILSYTFAALGFYVQFRAGFQLPFPLNLILSPFSLAEYYIRWSITSTK